MAGVSAEDEETAGVLRETIRDTPPVHFLFKVESLSLFSQTGFDQIKSNNFQVGGYHWLYLIKSACKVQEVRKILLFPNGNNGGKDDHVSIYLMMESRSSLPAGKGVNAFFKFFLFDQLRGKYLTVLQGRARRFDRVKYEWGFAKFISLEALKEPTNGFLVNDNCFFGVEIFVTEGSCIGECLSISKVANISGKYKWEIDRFSKLRKEHYSDEFVVGGYKWKLWLHPEGYLNHKGHSLSVFFVLVDFQTSTTVQDVRVEYMLTLKDQLYHKHIQKKGSTWFGASIQSKGWKSVIELKDLKDCKNRFLVDDCCLIEAQVTVLCETTRKTLNC